MASNQKVGENRPPLESTFFFLDTLYAYTDNHHNLPNYFPYCRSRLVTEKERRNVRRSHLLITTVILFVICWLPLNILNLGEDLDMPLQTWRQSGALSLVQIPRDSVL